MLEYVSLLTLMHRNVTLSNSVIDPKKSDSIGRVLQEARTSRGFTQAEIAPELGVSRATVAQIETGRRALRAEDLTRLAAFYGCSPSELMPRATGPEGIDGASGLFRSYPALAQDRGPSSFASVYETGDGKYLTVGCVEPWFYESLCRELGREDLAPHQYVYCIARQRAAMMAWRRGRNELTNRKKSPRPADAVIADGSLTVSSSTVPPTLAAASAIQ